MNGTPRTAALVVALALLVAPVGAGGAAATPPSLPAAYYGTLSVDGEPAPEDVTVTARVDGEVRDTITTDADGSFGGVGAFDEKLEVDAEPGQTVAFWVNGEPTGTTVEYESGSNQEVTLALDSLPVSDDSDAGDGDTGNDGDDQSPPGNEDSEQRDRSDSVPVVVDAQVTARGDGSFLVEAAASADEIVRVTVPEGSAADDSVTLDGLNVTVTEDAALSMDVSVSSEAPANVEEPGADVVAYIEVDESNSEETFGTVEFSFTIAKSALDDPESAALYRLHDGRWNRLETEFLGSSRDSYRFTATSPGLSVFAVREGEPSLSVTDASLAASSVTAGESTTVTATVENAGSAPGEMDVTLTVDGTAVATQTVSVPADESKTVTFEPTFEDAGTVSVAVGGVDAGELEVTPTTTASPTESNDGDGNQQLNQTPIREPLGLEFRPLGILVAGVVLLALFAAFRYRQQ